VAGVLDAGLTIQVSRETEAVRVTLAGTLDSETAAQVRSQLKPMLRDSPGTLLIDLNGVSYVDRPGVDALVHAARVAHRLGGRVALVHCPDQVHRMLAALGRDRLFTYQ